MITAASRREVMESQAYMLFYIKTRLEYRRSGSSGAASAGDTSSPVAIVL